MKRDPVEAELRRLDRWPLTPRESDLLGPILEGFSNQEIAEELGIRHATVRIYVHHILQKLHCRSRTEIAWLSLLLGLVELPEDPGEEVIALRKRQTCPREAA